MNKSAGYNQVFVKQRFVTRWTILHFIFSWKAAIKCCAGYKKGKCSYENKIAFYFMTKIYTKKDCLSYTKQQWQEKLPNGSGQVKELSAQQEPAVAKSCIAQHYHKDGNIKYQKQPADCIKGT